MNLPDAPGRRGEVVLVLFPDSNLRTAKRRPVLVVQADDLTTGLAQTIVSMITSNLARAGHPSHVSVSLATPEGQRTGLLRTGWEASICQNPFGGETES
jgi:mRNA interferase MazF